jgi:hypothetical protein
MAEIKETSEGFITFKVRTFVSVVAGLVIGTNVVNTVLHSISNNSEQIEYNVKAEKRRRESSIKSLHDRNTIIHLNEKVERLERDLKEARNK